MSKEVEALNYLVSLAVVGNKENHRGKIFESEEIVFQALKRNEPMKVDLTTEHIWFYKCPNCGVGYNIMEGSSYCPDCGQKLDWSDE